MDFNPAEPTTMHIDINSCFATIEQQANPLLRGYPLAVAAYDSPRGVILAASIEAKQYGIKTGMRVMDGKALFRNLKVVSPDTNKYRFVHDKMHEILDRYCSAVYPKSIDEFVLNFADHVVAKKRSMISLVMEMKEVIREEIGEWMSVSAGISTNRQLAKVAAGMIKPDGLVEINKDNFLDIYKKLKITDLNGINVRYEARLNSVGIYTVVQFYESSLPKLKSAFKSINASYWYTRLRGWEADDIEFATKSIGHSYSIPQDFTDFSDLSPILAKLVNKAANRMRKKGYSARGVHVGTTFKGGGYWHHGERVNRPLFYTSEIFSKAAKILKQAEIKTPVHTLSITCYDLEKDAPLQLCVFEDIEKKKNLAAAIDEINSHYGNFVVMTGNMAGTENAVPDRIAFGLPANR
jgi:DNA polymerase-4